MSLPDGGPRRSLLLRSPTRRQILWGAGGLVAGWASGWLGARWLLSPAGDGEGLAGGRRPSQLLFRGSQLRRSDDFLTPTDDFFIRSHFRTPEVATRPPDEWSISVEGEVDHPLTLRWAELKALERRKVPATLECAGNGGMNGINPPTTGRVWGGASTALWEGVSLASILRRAAPRSTVQEIVLQGADSGHEGRRPELMTFARSIPLAAALSDEALLALHMNDEPLPPIHGGPIRAIIPDRFATDSVKWLVKIRAVSTPFDGFYTTHRYRWGSTANPNGEGLGEMRVRSEIARPARGEELPRGLPCAIRGAAWGGTGGIREVVVSTDGGATFERTEWLDPEIPHCWRRFQRTWIPKEPGPRLLMARATDGSGQMQPLLSQEELGTGFSIAGLDRIQYANNSIQLVPVVVI